MSFSPNVESLAKHLDAVEVCNGSIHSILISHLNQCCTRNTLHKLHLQPHTLPVNSCFIKIKYITVEMFSPLINRFVNAECSQWLQSLVFMAVTVLTKPDTTVFVNKLLTYMHTPVNTSKLTD